MISLQKFEQADWAESVKVYIQISYTKILDIDTINQRFQAEALIESKWFDPHLNSLDDVIDERKIWKPEIYVENAIKDVREDVSYKIVPFHESIAATTAIKHLSLITTGYQYMMCELRKVSGIFYENLELEDFPLDIQDLTITVATKKPGKIVIFKLLQEELKNIQISHTLDKSMWKMHDVLITKEDNIHREYSFGSHNYPAVTVSAKVSRLAGFFYWNAIIPILLVSLASLAPFVVDIKFPQSRLPATCTLMLTSVSIRWTIGRSLPTVSYLTSLDKYSLASMFIITMELLYHGIMGAVFPMLPEKQAYRIDHFAFVFFCLLILTKQFIFAYWIYKVKHNREKSHQEFSFPDQHSTNDTT